MAEDRDFDRSGPSVPARAAGGDGSINFSSYSLPQLRELTATIDPDRAPLNFQNLQLELERREAGVESPETFSVKWTERNGISGWLTAVARRSLFYGDGFIQPKENDLVLGGWQRTWLGAPVRAEYSISSANIRNVFRDGAALEFQSKRPWTPTRHYRARATSTDSAARLATRLPSTIEAVSADLQTYNHELRKTGGTPWVTAILILANVAVFAAMAVSIGTIFGFNILQLALWGGNGGSLIAKGEWWRLGSAIFIHGDWLHLLLNLWVLWSVGRLTERLYGSWVYAAIYVSAGILGCLASLVWDPTVVSVGASGAIFGIVGAFVAYLPHPRTRVPSALVRSYLLPTLIFVAFNVIGGFVSPGIDNAGHVIGLLSGFVIGWIFAQSLDSRAGARGLAPRMMTAAIVIAVSAMSALLYLGAFENQATVPEQYFAARSWYTAGEIENQQAWAGLESAAATGTISTAALAQAFEDKVVPFWIEAERRTKEDDAGLTGEMAAFAVLTLDFIQARQKWALAIVDLLRDDTGQSRIHLSEKINDTIKAQALIARAQSRADLDRGMRSIADSRLGVWLRYSLGGWTCVGPPAYDKTPTSSDSADDGPSVRQAEGCAAQHMLMVGNYEALDQLIIQYAATMGDLPDGSSRLEGVISGLSDLFDVNGLPSPQALARMSDWRRAVPGSVNAELVEVIALSEAAYAARGVGSIDTVSAQGAQVFQFYMEMAAAALREIEDSAASNPVWYEKSISVGTSLSVETFILRRFYEAGRSRFPDYLPLQRVMLRELMPRWHGSYEDVEDLIREYATKDGQMDAAAYARLYLLYGDMERDDFNVVAFARANAETMRAGASDLLSKHPASNYILNAVARFHCIAGNWAEYSVLSPTLSARVSTVAWPYALTAEECNKRASAHSGDAAMEGKTIPAP